MSKKEELRGYKLSEFLDNFHLLETPYFPLYVTPSPHEKTTMKTKYTLSQFKSIEKTKRTITMFKEFQDEKYDRLLSELGLTKEDSREEYLFDYIFNDTEHP